MNEEGRFIGLNDEWVNFDFQDAVLSKQLSEYMLKTVQVKNPVYRQSTVFDSGVGAQLEINGFIYDEETHEFTRESTHKGIINETTIQFIDDENISSYNLLSDKMCIRDSKIRLDNMYEIYNIRPELLKSRQFYNNAFDTSVNYEDLMALKKELMI